MIKDSVKIRNSDDINISNFLYSFCNFFLFVSVTRGDLIFLKFTCAFLGGV